jgi:hypothetical protein
VRIKIIIKIDVKVRGSTNGIRNNYSINSFYYLTGNHTQRRFQSDDLSLIVHYNFLTGSY